MPSHWRSPACGNSPLLGYWEAVWRTGKPIQRKGLAVPELDLRNGSGNGNKKPMELNTTNFSAPHVSSPGSRLSSLFFRPLVALLEVCFLARASSLNFGVGQRGAVHLSFVCRLGSFPVDPFVWLGLWIAPSKSLLLRPSVYLERSAVFTESNGALSLYFSWQGDSGINIC